MIDNGNHIPPQSLESEQSVLGSMLIDNEQIPIVSMNLRERHFYAGKNKHLYGLILELHGRGEPVDMVTVIEALEKKGTLEKLGGSAYLSTLVEGVPTPKSAAEYARIVIEKSMLRDLIASGQEIMLWAYKEGNVSEIVANSEKLIHGITGVQADRKPTAQHVAELIEKLKHRAAHPNELIGITSGFAELDRITLGFEDGKLIILASRPGIGKTSIATQFGDAALGAGKLPLNIQLEMSASGLLMRVVSQRLGIPGQTIRAARFVSERESEAVYRELEKAGKSWEINDKPGNKIDKIVSTMRREFTKKPYSMVIVDHLQLIRAGNNLKRHLQVGEITRTLRAFAKEYEVPMILISQLKRVAENRRPRLADLKESGDIEQDADVVIFIHRPDYENHSGDPGKAEIIVAKHRDGPTGFFHARFEAAYTRFRITEKKLRDELDNGDYRPTGTDTKENETKGGEKWGLKSTERNP